VSIPQSYRSGPSRADTSTLEIPLPRGAERKQVCPRARRRWTWAACGLVLGVFVSSAGVVGAAYAGVIAPGPAGAGGFVVTAVPPRTVAETSPTDAPAPPDADAASGPRTSVGDGTWKVGEDIAPGRYTTAGADGSSCYYARLKSNDGSVGDVIDIKVTNGPASVVVRPTDGYLKTAYCRTWNRVG